MDDFKELKEMIEKLEKLAEDKKDNKQENKKNIQEAKENIKRYLKEDIKAVIFTSDEGHSTFVGSGGDLLGLFACLVERLTQLMPFEVVATTVVAGLALEDDGKTMNRDKINELLEVMKKCM